MNNIDSKKNIITNNKNNDNFQYNAKNLSTHVKSLKERILYIFIIYFCLKQNYIKQYKSLQTYTLFSGYRIL